jgi:thiamine biosynthesis lipoprotein
VDRSRGDHVVRFRSDAVAIDFGGIAKGYGVDRAVRALRDRGVENALVNAGGDLYAIGRSEDGGPWEVGVRDPLDPRRLAATLRVSDRAIATSGDYFQYFDHEGRRYHHLIDPDTGEPRESRLRSVTVAAETCMAADAGGTAAFGCELDAARDLIRRAAPAAEIVHTA